MNSFLRNLLPRTGVAVLALSGTFLASAAIPALSQPKAPMASAMMKPTEASVMTMTASWPEASRMAAKDMMTKYGPPAEATASHLMWRNNGPWMWTRIDNYETKHEFPAHHTDVMEQAISYQVKPEMADEIAAYDGSVYIRRTEGVISARCDKEGANFLALNLANDITTGKRNVADARAYYGKAIKEFKATAKMDPYMQGLKFQPMKPMMGDADVPQG